MQITVFGAGGRVGSRVVNYALLKGYDVLAFVHSSSDFQEHPNLKIYKGDIYKYDDVLSSLDGSQAVISALASWGTKTKDVQAIGMKNIAKAMDSRGVGRIISVTGTDARLPSDKPKLSNKLSRFAIGIIGRKVIEDGERHMALLTGTKLNWTVIRSPVMLKNDNADYVLTNEITPPWLTISYQAVAEAMVDQLEDKTYLCSAPFIKRA